MHRKQEVDIPVTAQQRHELFTWFEGQMGKERAATMMELMPPVGADELATKTDLHVLRTELKADMSALRVDLTRSFATWLLASQATVVTVMVGLLVAIR